MRRRRLLGLGGVAGGVLLVASLWIQVTVPAPDSYLFQPALTSDQGLLATVAPSLTVVGLLASAGCVVAAERRDRATFGRLHRVGGLATVGGLAVAAVGYAGLSLTDTATGSLGIVGGLAFAVLALVGVAVGGVGTGVLGVARLRGPRRRDRVVGGLLVAGPVLVGLAMVAGVGDLSELATAPVAVAYAALGVDVVRQPHRERGA